MLDVLADNGASGTVDRDGFNSLCKRKAGVVLAQDAARIFRDPEALKAFQRLCNDHEVQLAFTSGIVTDDQALWRPAETLEATHLARAKTLGS